MRFIFDLNNLKVETFRSYPKDIAGIKFIISDKEKNIDSEVIINSKKELIKLRNYLNLVLDNFD